MTSVRPLSEAERHAAAIAALGAGPARTRRFLEGYEPVAAWEDLATGRHRADPHRAYQSKARPSLVDAVASACTRSGIAVRIHGRPGYPEALIDDHEAPAILFTLGDPSLVDSRPRVTIVGTRSATPYGLGVASELGRGLAEAGVSVVSGLARGIDSAASAGALAVPGGAPTVAVIGTAPDAAVRRADLQLQAGIAGHGAVLSERAPGSGGAPPWCFVVRNRIMAALAHVVVVVECHRQSGSLHTVKAAADRDVLVGAVPGSVRSSASAGCNALLVDGAAPVRDVGDVLAALELVIAGRPGIVPPDVATASSATISTTTSVVGEAPGPLAARTLRALDHDPASLDTVVRRCGLPVADVAESLEQLAAVGLAVGPGGWWSRPSR
ncbi:MAG TPA: DNA-processing protein DprA [Acidimicrobiales bacterium]